MQQAAMKAATHLRRKMQQQSTMPCCMYAQSIDQQQLNKTPVQHVHTLLLAMLPKLHTQVMHLNLGNCT
jgi:hypothetical protein